MTQSQLSALMQAPSRVWIFGGAFPAKVDFFAVFLGESGLFCLLFFFIENGLFCVFTTCGEHISLENFKNMIENYTLRDNMI